MTDEIEFEIEPWAVDLTPSDALFVREFLVDLNTMQAMIRWGSTEENAKRNGSRMIRRPVIAKAIAAAMSERVEHLRITAKTVLGELWRCYLGLVGDQKWKDAAEVLDKVGKHVDVQAFRTQVGLSDPNGEPLEFDLNGFSTDEKRALLAMLERAGALQSGGSGEGSPIIN